MKFDVRVGVEEITEIVFGDIDPAFYLGTVIKRWGQNKVRIFSDNYVEVGVVKDKEHAENLIKALQKAIEIGWLK